MMDARVDSVDLAELSADEPPTRARRGGWLLSFVLFVLGPAILVWAYASFIAAPVYVSGFRIAVSGSGESAEGAAVARQAGAVAADYATSRQAVEDVRRSLNLATAFDPGGLDLLYRFWWNDGSMDELARYWRTQAVSARFDAQGGILAVTVRAFAPQDAQRIAQALEQNVEKLIGGFGADRRDDTLAAARDEVDRTAATLAQARKALQSFRAAQRTYTPAQTADATATLAGNLRGSLTTMNAQLAVLTHTLAPTAPAVSVLKAQIAATEQQLENVQNALGGKDATDASLPGQLDTFDELEAQRSLATALHDRAATLLQDATLQAVAQRPYATVFVRPAMPQSPTQPRPLLDAGVVLLVLAAAWTARLLVLRTVRGAAA